MVVPYEHPTGIGVWRAGGTPRPEPLTDGPPFARAGANSNRWHRIRSGFLRTGYAVVSDGTTYNLWCGPFVTVGGPVRLARANSRQAITSPVFPTGDGLPLCGTCEGRYLGAHPAAPELRFDPARHKLPGGRWCPGWGGQTSWSSINAYVQIKAPTPEQRAVGRFPAFCLVCASVVPLRGGGGPYRGWWGLTRHEPGPNLIDPCPFHGWKELTEHGGRVVCRCTLENAGW